VLAAELKTSRFRRPSSCQEDGDVAAASGMVGKSWLAEALRTWKVETFVAEISD
jgi:hypothetical protein